MSEDVKVTVAMAVYNTEEFLEEAVNNILTQTFQNYELLLIDDGSTDRSKDICNLLAKKDSRIRCFLKNNNEGLSVVRNLSIDKANGKYLFMVDSDDLMESDTIEKAVKMAEHTGADIVLWDFDTFSGVKPCQSGKSRLSELDTSDRSKLLRLPAFMPVRLVRTEYIKNRGWRFPKGLTKQDIPIHWAMMTDSKSRIAIIPERLFHYRQQHNATSQRKGRSLFSLAKVMDIARERLLSDNLYDTYRTEYLRSRLSLLHGMYDFIKPELKEEAMGMILERLDTEAEKFLNEDAKLLSYRTRLFYKMIRGSRCAQFKYESIMAARSFYRLLKSYL